MSFLMTAKILLERKFIAQVCFRNSFFSFAIRSIREFTNDDPSILDDEVSLEDPLNFYKMAVELFKWDSLHQNVLSWAVHLTGGIVRQLLSTRTTGEHAKVSGCLQLLRHAERLLTLIYYRDTEEGGVVCGLRDPPTVPVGQDDRVQYTTRYYDDGNCNNNINNQFIFICA